MSEETEVFKEWCLGLLGTCVFQGISEMVSGPIPHGFQKEVSLVGILPLFSAGPYSLCTHRSRMLA